MSISKLELLGALVAQSSSAEGDTEIDVLIRDARKELDKDLEDAQYGIWKRNGEPGFAIEVDKHE